MADHPDDVVRRDADVKGAVASAGEAAVASEQLPHQREQVHPAPGEHAQVPVHRQDRIFRLERRRDADGDGLLADAGEPLRQAALAEQDEHLLFEEAREDERAVKRERAWPVERAVRGGDGE